MAQSKGLFTPKKIQGMVITIALSMFTVFLINKVPFLKRLVGG